MSALVHFAACAINQTALDWEGNQERLMRALSEARSKGASVIVTPELSICGYGCEDAYLSDNTMRESLRCLSVLLPLTKDCLAMFGLPYWIDGKCYNVMAVCLDGKVIGVVPKQHLAGDGVHYEPRWFVPWPANKMTTVTVLGAQVPFGDLLFELDHIRFGVEICRDAWVSDRSGKRLVARGAHVLLNPTGSHFGFGKLDQREAIADESINELNVAYVYANQAGNDAGKIIFDGDTRIAAPGTFYHGPRLRIGSVHVLDATLDLLPILSARPLEAFNDELTVVTDYKLPECTPVEPTLLPEPWQEIDKWRKEEEFCRAVTVGLFDYMRKSRSTGFVINLSGGADSAACAVLVKLMLLFAVEQYGLEGVQERLSYISDIKFCQTLEAMTKRLLCCIYQGTLYNSDLTLEAAKVTAQGLGATFYQWPIQEIVDTYCRVVEEAIDQKLDWEHHDLALQNVQARVRGPAAWLVANVRGAILLSTGNRSEAAVGYTTMDGDTCGGLSPIGGVDKAFVLQWLNWMEKEGPEGVEAMPFLSSVNKLQPSAELRPEAQLDEEELMPYVLMSKIEDCAIRQKCSPIQTFQFLSNDESIELPREQLKAHVIRFYELWSKNQWKRERYAPAFHLDDKSLDPKSWCRFPILSGGFSRELDDLKKL